LPTIGLEQSYANCKLKFKAYYHENKIKKQEKERILDVISRRQYKEKNEELMKKESDERAKNGTNVEIYL
jgi:hypothetical protein